MSNPNSLFRIHVGLWLGALLICFSLACGDDAATDAGDAAADSGECVAGEVGCECGEMDACDRGQCVAGTCALCTRGDEGCLCRRDGTCGEGLCDEGICRACEAGTPGCPCDGRGRCEEGSMCTEGLCVGSDCALGSDGCPCRTRSAPVCDEALTCLGDALCYACDADRAGCACRDDGSCADGLSCELGTCQAPPRCTDLVDAGLCSPGERCTEGAEGATCVRGECEAGFVFFDGECIAGEANCRPGEPGSMLEGCSSLSRECVSTDDGAECGECNGDTTEVDGVCQGPVPCGDANCASFEYCDRSVPEPFCAELPCPVGQARGTTGVCTPCGFSCGGEGLSGRVFPFRTVTDACVCETLPGYYMPPGGTTTPERCDADGDGWVRAEITEPLIQVDPTLRQNARCELLEVDGVLLRDEHGLDVEVASCEGGLFVSPEPEACFVRVPMPLVESARNDLPGVVGGGSVGAPGTYGDRRLTGIEVNDLTKFCVDDVSDFNDNGVEDLLEEQADGSTLGSASGRTRLQAFAHFGELHRSYPIAPPGARYGKLVIEERFRCDPRDFPLRYDPAVDPSDPSDGYDDDDGSTYWRSCQRGTAPEYTPGVPNGPGFDFAQWSCSDGECVGIPEGPPSARRDLVAGPIEFGQPPPRAATLCELGARRPIDGLWRGMNHHSQFRCVHAGATGPAGVSLGTFATGALVLNECSATECAEGDAGCAEARPVSPTGTALEPVLTCRARASVDSAVVGFAAVPYRPYGTRFIMPGEPPGMQNRDYRGGCVSEDAEFANHICPAPVFQTDSELDSFGRESCFVAPCPLGQADCDGNEFNGCEMEARDLVNCNGCGVACAPPNANGDCSTGLCQVASCRPGFGNCDSDPSNGCETMLNSLLHCAECSRECSAGGADVSCASGACQVISCDGLTADCDGEVSNGCEVDISTNTDCGGCGVACELPGAIVSTCSDEGVCEVTSCVPGLADCDGLQGNGCETDIFSSLENCGACSTDEAPTRCDLANATSVCDRGICTIDGCDEGFGDCDFVASTGCELPTDDDTRNCGECLAVCDVPNASEMCIAGECVIGGCDDARSNCDEETAGCETSHEVLVGECATGESLGSMDGDQLCGTGFLGICENNLEWNELAVRTGTGQAWFRARVVEDSNCSASIEHRIRLTVPDGVDYDLHVQKECESGSARQSSAGGRGSDESITVSTDDGSGDQSFDYSIFVEYFGGASCEEWELVVEGHECPGG